MQVSGQLQAPAALPPQKVRLVPIEQEDGWVPEPIWTLWRGEESLFPAENRTPAVCTVAPSLYWLGYPAL
jgi:hypothetical protein